MQLLWSHITLSPPSLCPPLRSVHNPLGTPETKLENQWSSPVPSTHWKGSWRLGVEGIDCKTLWLVLQESAVEGTSRPMARLWTVLQTSRGLSTLCPADWWGQASLPWVRSSRGTSLWMKYCHLFLRPLRRPTNAPWSQRTVPTEGCSCYPSLEVLPWKAPKLTWSHWNPDSRCGPVIHSPWDWANQELLAIVSICNLVYLYLAHLLQIQWIWKQHMLYKHKALSTINTIF